MKKKRFSRGKLVGFKFSPVLGSNWRCFEGITVGFKNISKKQFEVKDYSGRHLTLRQWFFWLTHQKNKKTRLYYEKQSTAGTISQFFPPPQGSVPGHIVTFPVTLEVGRSKVTIPVRVKMVVQPVRITNSRYISLNWNIDYWHEFVNFLRFSQPFWPVDSKFTYVRTGEAVG